MAADGHHNNQELRFLRQVDPAIWKACAGNSVQIPAVGARVFYFPQGHMEHLSAPKSAIVALSQLTPAPMVYCRVVQVLFLSDPDTDEVYARIRMEPLPYDESFRARPPTGNSTASTSVVGSRMAVMDGSYDERREEDDEVVSFAKVLTPSDANNGGGFSVPRFCADLIFPPLDFEADPPVQTVTITDVRGESWSFRHIYRGTPKRHLLTTGWSKFVNSKKLIASDSVVFIKNKNTGRLFVGVRRSAKPASSVDAATKWAMQYGALAGHAKMMRPDAGEAEARFSINGGHGLLAEVLELVAKNMPFEVVYYPKAGSRDFVVAAEKVKASMAVNWASGIRVKMGMETEDSSRMTWFQGTVQSISVQEHGSWQRSPWRMLQVAWDEPEVLENIKSVSPWQVEVLSPVQAIEAAYPQAKRIKFPQNYGRLTNGGAEIRLPCMGLSSSMIEHLSSSQHLSYNIFPAGIQGARQDTYYIPSLANTVDDVTRKVCHVSSADNNPIQKAEAVSTDLNMNMASSQSDNVSPDTSSSILSSSPEAAESSAPKPFILFGQIICTDGQGEDPNPENQETEEGEGPGSRLDLSLSDPCMDMLQTTPVAEADPS